MLLMMQNDIYEPVHVSFGGDQGLFFAISGQSTGSDGADADGNGALVQRAAAVKIGIHPCAAGENQIVRGRVRVGQGSRLRR